MRNKDASVYLSLAVAVLLHWLAPATAHARLLQIIHTNDLHSHLEHAEDPAVGGYAAIKAKIDELKAEASAQGIETLTLDAGDFSEGSQFYLAGEGTAVWRTMNAMGYDAAVMGNHDWLMGPDDLDQLLEKMPPSFSLLGANFIYDPKRKNIAKYMKPYGEFVRNGIKIGVLGLSTDEFVYSWRAKEGFVYNPAWEASTRIPELRSRNDFVIALTHMGIQADRNLVRQTDGIDLVVGGHSHTQLEEPLFQKDRRGRLVPIVQAGEHGHFIGDLLLSIEPGQDVQVIRYRLVPIESEGPRDPHMEHLVQQARTQLEDEYGASWLYEVVGHTNVTLKKQVDEPTTWSQLVVDTMKEHGGADLALDVPPFSGLAQPPGPITREQIFILYPRIFEMDRRMGWTIWTAKVRGWILKLAIEQALQQGFPFSLSGVTWELIKKENGDRKVRNLRIGGEKIKPWKNYRIALPEGVARGSFEISSFFRTIVKRAKDSRIPMWTALEKQIRKHGVIDGHTRSP